MLYAKLIYVYEGWPDVCTPNNSNNNKSAIKNSRFEQNKSEFKSKSNLNNKTTSTTNQDFTSAQRTKLKNSIDDLWSTIDTQCKGMEIGIEQCQEKIFSDSLINSKMADLVDKVPKIGNSSAADLHQINMKIIDDIQNSLNEPGISSEELKKRVYEVSKLLPLNHPASETVDSVKEFLTIQEAEEEKRKNKDFGKQLD